MNLKRGEHPKVTLHILQTVDGHIDGDFFSLPAVRALAGEYGRIRDELGWDAIVYGATTAHELFAHENLQLNRCDTLFEGDFIPEDSSRWIAVIDPEGTLGYASGICARSGMEGARFIELLCEETNPEYRAYLHRIGVGYLICGRDSFDAKLACEKLARLCGVEHMLLQGGGVADGTFAVADCIDELSLVLVPAAELSEDAIPVFNTVRAMNTKPLDLELIGAEQLGHSGIWLRYAVR